MYTFMFNNRILYSIGVMSMLYIWSLSFLLCVCVCVFKRGEGGGRQKKTPEA